jgi:hypothetical protein
MAQELHLHTLNDVDMTLTTQGQVLHTHHRQAAIRIANNQNIAKTHGTAGWDKHPHQSGLSSFKYLRAVDVVNTYNTCARGHASRQLMCQPPRVDSLTDLGLPHSRCRMQCPDMRYMSIALPQHLVYFHGETLGMLYMGHQRARHSNALQHMVGGVVMVKGNFWAGCMPGLMHTLFPCKVLEIQKVHVWPDGSRSRAYQMVVVAHLFKDFLFHGQQHRPFVMMLGETYAGKLSAFDFAQCRDDRVRMP